MSGRALSGSSSSSSRGALPIFFRSRFYVKRRETGAVLAKPQIQIEDGMVEVEGKCHAKRPHQNYSRDDSRISP